MLRVFFSLFAFFSDFISLFLLCRWIRWKGDAAEAIRPEHGVWTLRRDNAAGTVGACSEVRFEPSAGNREALEEWESSDGVLVEWSHLGEVACFLAWIVSYEIMFFSVMYMSMGMFINWCFSLFIAIFRFL